MVSTKLIENVEKMIEEKNKKKVHFQAFQNRLSMALVNERSGLDDCDEFERTLHDFKRMISLFGKTDFKWYPIQEEIILKGSKMILPLFFKKYWIVKKEMILKIFDIEEPLSFLGIILRRQVGKTTVVSMLVALWVIYLPKKITGSWLFILPGVLKVTSERLLDAIQSKVKKYNHGKYYVTYTANKLTMVSKSDPTDIRIVESVALTSEVNCFLIFNLFFIFYFLFFIFYFFIFYLNQIVRNYSIVCEYERNDKNLGCWK